MMSNRSIEVRIKEALESVQRQTQGISGFVVFTRDGFPITGTMHSERLVGDYEHMTDSEFFAAIGAGIVSLSERTLEQMDMLPMDKMIIESPKGNIVVEKVDDYIGVMAISRPDAPLGLVRMALERVKRKVKELLETA